jgi:hypothetical protein
LFVWGDVMEGAVTDASGLCGRVCVCRKAWEGALVRAGRGVAGGVRAMSTAARVGAADDGGASGGGRKAELGAGAGGAEQAGFGGGGGAGSVDMVEAEELAKTNETVRKALEEVGRSKAAYFAAGTDFTVWSGMLSQAMREGKDAATVAELKASRDKAEAAWREAKTVLENAVKELKEARGGGVEGNVDAGRVPFKDFVEYLVGDAKSSIAGVPTQAPATPAAAVAYDDRLDPKDLRRLADEVAGRLVSDVVASNSASNNANVLRRVLGPNYVARYREPVPVSTGENAHGDFVALLMPYYGSAAAAYHGALKGLVVRSGSADETLVVAQASGSGKTKLAYAEVQRPDGVPTVLVRVTVGEGFAKPWKELVKVLEEIMKLENESVQVKDRMSRDQVMLLLGCYVLWARAMAKALDRAAAAKPLSNRDKAVALVLAVRNGSGDNAVLALYLAGSRDPSALLLADPCSGATALAKELGCTDVSLFIDEAQFCKGKLEGYFRKVAAPAEPTDLFHALASAGGTIASTARVVLCGTHPHMYQLVREVSGAQGGPEAFSVSTHITSDAMVDSLVHYLHVSKDDLTADKVLMKDLKRLEGRAAHFFGKGWEKIQGELEKAASETKTVDCVKQVLTEVVKTREADMANVVRTFVAKAPTDVKDEVLDAVLWEGGVLAKTAGGWPDAFVVSGLAVVQQDAVAISFANEPTLHHALTKELAQPEPLKTGKGFGAFLRSVVRSNKGLGWEKTFALYALARGFERHATLTDVLGQVAVSLPWGLNEAQVLFRRIASAKYDLFSCLFDADGTPLDDVIAVNFNIFAGPDAAFFTKVGEQQHVLVLVQNKNVETGTVVKAVKSVTLGRIGEQVKEGNELDERTETTRRARANVAELRAKSQAARHAFDNAIRVIAHPFGFDERAIRRINEFNERYPAEPILLVTKHPDNVHKSILRSAKVTPVPSMTLGPVHSDADLERVTLDSLLADSKQPKKRATAAAAAAAAAADSGARSMNVLRLVLTGHTKDVLLRVCDDLGLSTAGLTKANLAAAIVDHIPKWRAVDESRAPKPDLDVVNEWVVAAKRN